jgi:catalase
VQLEQEEHLMETQPHGQYRNAPALVEAIHKARGFHPGFRALHATGRIYRCTFTASGDGAALTRAVHCQPGAVVPTTARYSYSASDPEEPPAALSTMAVKFYLDDGTVTDLVGINAPAFFAGVPDDVFRVLAAQGDPEAMATFAAERPNVAAAIKLIAAMPAPKSLAETAYNSLNAFWFENAAGERRAGRYRWEPEAGISGQSVDELQALPNDYLFTELEERLSQGPVQYALYVSLAEPEDDLTDPATPWPEPRERVLLGQMALQRRTSTAEIGDPIMLHDPTRLTDGIDVTDDPILNVRRGVYEVSAVNRGDSWKVRAAKAATPE